MLCINRRRSVQRADRRILHQHSCAKMQLSSCQFVAPHDGGKEEQQQERSSVVSRVARSHADDTRLHYPDIAGTLHLRLEREENSSYNRQRVEILP